MATTLYTSLAGLILATLTTPAMGQTAAAKPLDLTLAPGGVPAASTTTAQAVAQSASNQTQQPRPGVYYGDTSGRTDRQIPVPVCDDSAYNQTQVHGSVGAGVATGDHVNGSYQTGRVRISKAFGNCEHHAGGISISIGVSKGDIHHHWGH